MDVRHMLYITSREGWRRRLANHHRQRKEVWFIFYKKSSRKRSIFYDDAVEEAIRYGWIDSQVKRIDEWKFARRFTPRGKNSKWSKHNKARALKMLLEGRMIRAGEALLPTEVLKMKG